jgi:translocation and assembly module TamB
MSRKKGAGVEELIAATGWLPNAYSKRVRVGVQTGATAGETGISVDVDLTKRIRLRGEADANGATSVGIGTEWEY